MDHEHHIENPDTVNIVEDFDKQLTLVSDINTDLDIDIDTDLEDYEFEFAFDKIDPTKSPVSAEDLFHNGQIRPTTPFVVPDKETVVKNMFVMHDDVVVEAQPGPEMTRKSNSTGFSRLRKMKELLVRSNSDGKDTFVFLTKKDDKKKKNDDNNLLSSSSSYGSSSQGTGTGMKKKKTMMAAYESFYGGKNKEKKGGEKSYLPYKVGFFTNGNGLSKNVHPY